jgi:acetyltransferase-like isoleucine patch superfamily enzyme
MSRFFRSVVWREDPLRLLARIPKKLYSMWVCATYPFASVGHGVEIHYTWDFRKYLAHRVKLGSSVSINKDVHFGVYCPNEEKGEPMLVIDDGCVIMKSVQISARNCIHIERQVIVSSSVVIMDHNHAFENVTLPIMEQGITAGGTIRIEQGCWIGHGAAIICNQGELVLGRNSVVAANALVTKGCPPYSVLVGNPARIATQFDPVKGIWIGLPGRTPKTDHDKANDRNFVGETSGR